MGKYVSFGVGAIAGILLSCVVVLASFNPRPTSTIYDAMDSSVTTKACPPGLPVHSVEITKTHLYVRCMDGDVRTFTR